METRAEHSPSSTTLCSSTGSSDLPTTPFPGAGPSPVPCPHRHHVVLQLLQPHTAVVTAAAGGGQAVVGLVEGGRGGTAVIRFEGLVGAVATGRQESVGPTAPRLPTCPPPPLHGTHHRAGLGCLCSGDRHPSRCRDTHPGAGTPTPVQGHSSRCRDTHPGQGHPGGGRLTRSCSSCSRRRSRTSHPCGSSRLGRENQGLRVGPSLCRGTHPPPISPMPPCSVSPRHSLLLESQGRVGVEV